MQTNRCSRKWEITKREQQRRKTRSSKSNDLISPDLSEDIIRWGIWRGLYICQTHECLLVLIPKNMQCLVYPLSVLRGLKRGNSYPPAEITEHFSKSQQKIGQSGSQTYPFWSIINTFLRQSVPRQVEDSLRHPLFQSPQCTVTIWPLAHSYHPHTQPGVWRRHNLGIHTLIPSYTPSNTASHIASSRSWTCLKKFLKKRKTS